MSSDYLYIIDDIKRAETLSKINQGRDSIEDASTEERSCKTTNGVISWRGQYPKKHFVML